MQESQPTEFLFDILYADRERLNLYLAQIDPNGVLTGFKTSSTDRSDIASSIKAGVGVASVGYNGTASNQDVLESSYDPAAALPVQVLNLLDEHNYIHREVEKTPIGSLLLTQGSLSLLDLSYVLTLWPLFEKKIDFKNMVKKINTEIEGGKCNVSDLTKIVKEIFEKIPQPIHMLQSAGMHTIWGTLADAGFMSPPTDLFLKYKNTIPGEWFILSILDCLDEPSTFSDPKINTVGASLLSGFQELFGPMISVFGRPDHAIGITPLIIFRKVTSCSRSQQS